MELDVDEARAGAKGLIGVGQSLAGLVGKASLAEGVGQALPGSDTAIESTQVEQTLKQHLQAQADWPPRVAKEVLDAVSTITGQDEANAAGLKIDTSGDPPGPSGKTNSDQPPPAADQAHPGDQPHDAPPPAEHAGATGEHPVPIPVGDVQYTGSGTFASGKEQTRGYINQALDKLGITDPAARERWTQGYLTMAEHESSYNAPTSQVNTWDRNAKESTYNVADGYGNQCSRGIVQCIPTTFAQYHQPGTSNNIYDPVANICASMNYVMDTYHVSRDASNLNANVGQSNAGTRQGY